MQLKNDVEKLVNGYFEWLKTGTVIDAIDDMAVVTTPHMDRHNDFLQVVIQRTPNGFALSDDGYILADLAASGCAINSPKRKAILSETLNGFGVINDHDTLVVHASETDFSKKKHALVQAMLTVNDMFYMSSRHVSSLFYEDVCAWLRVSNIPSVQNIQIAGKSGYTHKFDFVIPMSRTAPERVLKTINNPTRQTALQCTSMWGDVQPNRPESKAFALLDDVDTVGADVINALKQYEVEPLLWSDRDNFSERLAA